MIGADPILFAAAHQLGKAYGHSGAHTTNCVRFVHAILEIAYGIRISGDAYKDIMISHGDRSRPYSPIGAIVALGIGEREEGPPLDARWSVCQGWRRLDAGRIPSPDPAGNGHCWLMFGGPDPWMFESHGGASPWLHRCAWSAIEARYAAGIRRCVLSPPVGDRSIPAASSRSITAQ